MQKKCELLRYLLCDNVAIEMTSKAIMDVRDIAACWRNEKRQGGDVWGVWDDNPPVNRRIGCPCPRPARPCVSVLYY
jgi:hypothetical protein